MDTNRYDVRYMPEAFSVSPDGTTISKMFQHRSRDGHELQLFGTGVFIERDSIRVISSTSAVAVHCTTNGLVQGQGQGASEHPNYNDYLIHVIVEPQDRRQGTILSDLGNIDLMLTYITRSAYWIPRYMLDIRSDGVAALTLRADLHPPSAVWEGATIVISNYSATLTHWEITQAFNGSGERVQQLPRFTHHTWCIPQGSLAHHILENVQIRDVLVSNFPNFPGSEARPDFLKVRHSTGTRSLPEGRMQITQQGKFITSVQIPRWNPGGILAIYLGENTSVLASTEPRKAQILDPCSISHILNPGPNERPPAQQTGAELGIKPNSSTAIPDNATKQTDNGRPSSMTAHQASIPKARGVQYLMLPDHQGQSRDGKGMPGNGALPPQSSRAEVMEAKTSKGLHPQVPSLRSFEGKLGSGTSSKTVDSVGAGPSQPLITKPKEMPVSVRISQFWRDSVAYEWAPLRCQWEIAESGILSSIDVLVEDDPQPVRLSLWGEHGWRSRLYGGSCVTITHGEVIRMIEKDGFGRGIYTAL